MLKKGIAELDPMVAQVNAASCTMCGLCEETCPYDAVNRVQFEGREVAEINAAVCKGCGGCAPVCPEDAIDLRGYTDAQIRAMIENLAEVPAL
jgi:heterodisulfide reductase subunit A